MLNKKFAYVLNWFRINKTAHKINWRTHLLQQNKKTVLKTVAYFKISTPVRS